MLLKIIKAISELVAIIAASYGLYSIHKNYETVPCPLFYIGLLIFVIIFYGYAFIKSSFRE